MTFLLIVNKSIPDVGIAIIFLIAILLILMALNNLFEWLTKKPWRRNKPPGETIPENQILPGDQESKTGEEEHVTRNSGAGDGPLSPLTSCHPCSRPYCP